MNDTDKIMDLAYEYRHASHLIDPKRQALRAAIDQLTQQLTDARSECTALRVNEQNLMERLAAGELVGWTTKEWLSNPPGGLYRAKKTSCFDVPLYTAPQPAASLRLAIKVTEEMHVAACKVLNRANGLDDLPQRMVDAMLAAAPQPAAEPAQDAVDARLVYASPIFTTAIDALNKVKAWRDCDGNDGFPHDVREQIDAVLMAYEARAAISAKKGGAA